MPAPDYQPITSEVTPAERRFLDLVAPLGVDWLTTREEYRQRCGISSYYGWSDVIALPPSSAVSRSPLTFVMYADPNVLDLCPEYLWANYMPHDDARENHRDIEQQLSAHFGEPTINDVSNCLRRKWSFGVFKLELHTFPPELQSPALLRSNSLLQKNPRLRIASSISLHSEYAHAYPDASLSSLATWLCDSVARKGRAGELACSATHGRPGHHSRRYTRRNPGALATKVAESALIAWRDDPHRRLGITAHRESVVFPSTQAARLILTHLKPARGPGGFSLALDAAVATTPPSRSSARIGILDAPGNASLEQAASQLSEIWRLPLCHEEADDD
ncbi:MAG TPA: hypothetical protein VHP33_29730 [Polyangiaceae bacterium]|nr:hypothetical protein [Polyangiaceae bacterium]